jgi:membrane protein DedA with SNARE-associated domain
MLDLIERYGYLAVFAGAFVEGETLLVIAGFLASGGHLELVIVMLFGFLGGLAGDQCYFYLGRAGGRPLLERHASWLPRTERIERILARHGTLLMLGYRFMYGVRLITPLVLGAFGVSRLRFLGFNLINASAWATLVAGLGFAFGEVITRMFAEVRRYELLIVIVLGLVGFCVWLVRRARERRRMAAETAPTEPGP